MGNEVKLTAPSPLKSTTSNYNKIYLFLAVNMYNKFNQTEHLYGCNNSNKRKEQF